MKTIISKKSSFVLGLFSLALMSCSSHSELDDVINPTNDDVATISISVKAPASDAVVISKAATVQTAEESTINNMIVYLFKADPAASTDAQYKYHSEHKFANGDLVNGGANITCSFPIPSDLFGETVKVAVVANDVAKYESLVANTTTLDEFKKALAGATVSDNDQADALIGGVGTHSFPMSCIVAKEQLLTIKGASFTAELVRNVARLEIFNNVPNLTIKGISIANVSGQSCIFASDNGSVNEPNYVSMFILNPLQAFTEMVGSGLPFKSNTGDDKANNTYIFAYLYEQRVSNLVSDSPVISVYYDLTVDDNHGGTICKPGLVSVRFERSISIGKERLYVRRNHRYTIQLGEGKNVSTGIVNATFNVADWVKGDDIPGDLTPKN